MPEHGLIGYIQKNTLLNHSKKSIIDFDIQRNMIDEQSCSDWITSHNSNKKRKKTYELRSDNIPPPEKINILNSEYSATCLDQTLGVFGHKKNTYNITDKIKDIVDTNKKKNMVTIQMKDELKDIFTNCHNKNINIEYNCIDSNGNKSKTKNKTGDETDPIILECKTSGECYAGYQVNKDTNEYLDLQNYMKKYTKDKKSEEYTYPLYIVNDNDETNANKISNKINLEIATLKKKNKNNVDAINAAKIYRYAIENNITYMDATNHINKEEYKKKIDKEQNKIKNIQKNLALYNAVISSGNQTEGALENINLNSKNNITSNFSNLNNIDENILTISQEIIDTKDKYNYNSKIVKYLNIILIILFILMIIMFSFYGIKSGLAKKYGINENTISNIRDKLY